MSESQQATSDRSRGKHEPQTFVLIHGMWHADWTWEAVARTLRAHGHHVFAPTARGHGPGEDRAAVTHQDCVDALVQAVEERDLRQAVLVAHSWGGFLLCAAAPRLEERIDRMVFWNAFVPEQDETIISLSAPEDAERYRAMASSDDFEGEIRAPWDEWRGSLMLDCSDEAAKLVYDLLGTQAYSTFAEPLDVAAFSGLRIPTTYINGTHDRGLPNGEWLGLHAARLWNPTIVDLPIDHEALFTAPDVLARALMDAG